MNIQEALAFIEKYTEHYGKEEYNGHPEWEIQKMPDDDPMFPGMYQVRCYEPEKVGGGNEDIIWADGFTGSQRGSWWDRRPDFKQAYLTEHQVILLATDLMVELDENVEL